ncbi:signal recognition particle-docking protein FtsY [Desulfobulbus sp. US1]|nr:signal recognition particle-docking protein FtsY [Desulfobulbus sp. US4]MCW5207833.1 signal recognition particle-docking protein FtsY [Desulfobulbus sp. US2]MCW5209452.1 signal recognition particle-docking protein FtsY [Desulfobulbus sp. US1]WLE97315.1 MAG: signal recognition particle-docking protein FtsY [Candidatus Electrothrix communis]
MLGWFKKKLSGRKEKAAVEETAAQVDVQIDAQVDGTEGLEPSASSSPVIAEKKPDKVAPAAEPAPMVKAEEQAAELDQGDADGQEKPQRPSMFKRLQERLGKSRNHFVHRLDNLFRGRKEIDQDLFDELEEILITADLGVNTAMALLDAAKSSVKREQLSDPQALKEVLRDKILSFLQESAQPAELVLPDSGPFVIMVVGVNGVGKTTSIGKLAAKFVGSGQSVLLVAGDTFRAAAIDQLKIWGDRTGVEVVAGPPKSDPSSVVFDGVAKGVAKNYDVVIIDTAGRLHTSVNLMEELKKIRRVVGKNLATAPHEVMLVVDATTGQNAISQAKMFNEAVGVTGLTLTKLDGTAKGGIVANICHELKIPVRFIGIGEQVEDLRDFDPEEFVDALFSVEEGS